MRNLVALVRSAWGYDVDALVPLSRPWAGPAGEPGPRQHWRAEDRGRPTLLVTRHRVEGVEAARLEDALAATTDLSFGLDFVIASLPSSAGTWTVPVFEGGHPDGAISVTPWVHATPGETDPTRMLTRLHAAHPPRRAPRWEPLAVSDLADPAGPEAAAYRRLAEQAVHQAGDQPWVPTHGDPSPRHRLLTPVRTLLTGWSGLRVAPRERDGVAGDPAMVELFTLERGLLAAMGHPQGR